MNTDPIIEERFLLGNVLQIAVLNHAETFKNRTIDHYFDLIEAASVFADLVLKPLYRTGSSQKGVIRKGRIKTPTGYQKAWRSIRESVWQNVFRSMDPSGEPLPKSVAIALREKLYAGNPVIGNILASTMLTGELMQRYGKSQVTGDIAKKLLNLEACGAIALFEPGDTHHLEIPGTTAVLQEDGSCLVRGIKDRVVAGDHDISERIVYLVTARFEKSGSEEEQILLLAVPGSLENSNGSEFNHIRMEEHQTEMGLNATPCVRIRFGEEGDCLGFPLTLPGSDISDIVEALRDWYAQLSLQALIHTSAAVAELNHFGNETTVTDERSPESFKARLAPTNRLLGAFDQGLRGALYMSAFHQDCYLHGAESQKETFYDLNALYTALFTTYAPVRAMEVVSTALNQAAGIAFDSRYDLERNLKDLQAVLLVNQDAAKAAEDLLESVLPAENGRIFQQLLKQFEMVDSHQVVSESLNESIAVWRDYIGGLIVLFDDIMQGQENPSLRISKLFAGHILRLFGDVIVCYHLILQAIEAERILVEADANFYHLRQTVSIQPELQRWYKKIQLAEFFAVHVLSMQESVIRLIQRDPQALLETF